MKKTNIKLIVLFLFVITQIKAQTITVDNNPNVNAQYTDLQAAIDAASPNTTIYVQPSVTTYSGVTIDKPLTIIGKSHSETGFISKIADIHITYNGSNTTIKGLEINSISFQGLGGTASTVPIPVENVTIEYNIITNGIQTSWLSGGSYNLGNTNNLIIRGNIIRGGIVLHTSNASISNNIFNQSSYNKYLDIYNPDATIIINNIFTHYESIIRNQGYNFGNVIIQNSMFLFDSSSPEQLNFDNVQLDNCLAYNYGTGNTSINATATNMVVTNMLLDTNPLFTNLELYYNETFNPLNDYTLQASSPAIGAGINGEDIGIHGNGYTFNNLGNPVGYPSVQIISSTGSIPQNGTLQVNFSGIAH